MTRTASLLRSFAASARALGVTTANIHPDHLSPHVVSSLLAFALEQDHEWFPYERKERQPLGWIQFSMDGVEFAIHSQCEPERKAA